MPSTLIKVFILSLLLSFQTTQRVDNQDSIQLELDRLRISNKQAHNMITLRARYPDGTPASKGYIGCSGLWYKHSDNPNEQDMESGEAYMFLADSRGAVILNPNLWDTYFHCWAEHKEAKGETKITEDDFYDGMIREIIIK